MLLKKVVEKSKFTLILSAFLAGTFVYSVNSWFSMSGFYLVISTAIILTLVIFTSYKSFPILALAREQTLSIVLLIFILLGFTVTVVDINGELSLAMFVNRFFYFLSFMASMLFLCSKSKSTIVNKLISKKFLLLLIFAFIIQLTSLRVLKKPDIDVYDVLKNGPLRLLRLENPYRTAVTMPSLEGKNFGYYHYAYGPVTIYLFLPFDFLLGDPRYLLVITSFVTVYTLYNIVKMSGGTKEYAQLLSLIFLFNPKQFYFLSYSWTDGLIVSLVMLALLFYKKNKIDFFGIFLALSLGVKIFYALPFLFFLKMSGLRTKRFVLPGLITLLLVHLPFLIWDYRAIYTSIVKINTDPEVFASLRRSGLTVATFLDRQFHYYPPESFFVLSLFFIVILFWFIIPKSRDIVITISSVSLVFFVSVFLGPIGIANYYYSASCMLLGALAFMPSRKNTLASG